MDHRHVLAAARHALEVGTGVRYGHVEQEMLLERVGFRAIAGGLSNNVYRYHLDGEDFVLKLYPRNSQQHDWREWTALTLFQQQVAGLAPRPVLHLPSALGPAVVMTLVPGEPLGARPLDGSQLEALRSSLQSIYVVPLKRAAPLLPASGEVGAILARVWRDGAKLTEYPAPAVEPSGTSDLRRLWRAWTVGPDTSTLREPAEQVFSRGDPNLRNALWDGARLRLVDFEDSGWSDRATDLADMVEHVQSRHTSDAAWLALVDALHLSKAERRRFGAARRLFALFWALVLFHRERAGSTGTLPFADQLTRMERLAKAGDETS